MRAAFVDNSKAEALALAGVVLMESPASAEARPMLPRSAVAALRVCYAALTSPNRPGPLRERVMLLAAIPKLVKLADGHAMAKRAEDVIDVALVREGGALASVAMIRILSRMWRQACRMAEPKIKSGALDKHEAASRMQNGIFGAVLSWEPLHESGSVLATQCGWRVPRALQLRGRKDWAIAAQKDESGRWTGGAVSLEALIPANSDGESFVPHATSYSSAAPVPLVCAEHRNKAEEQSVRYDVLAALDILGETDRKIAVMLWSGSKTPMTQVAVEVELSVAEVKARAKQVRLLLATLLADYAEGEVPV
jgi:hypothetical protein